METNNESQALVIAEAAFRKALGTAPFDGKVELTELGVMFWAGINVYSRQVVSEDVLTTVNDPAAIGREVGEKFKRDFIHELRRLADELEGKF